MSNEHKVCCFTCGKVKMCQLVDLEKLKSSFFCGDWLAIPEPEIEARIETYNRFGDASLNALMNPDKGGG